MAQYMKMLTDILRKRRRSICISLIKNERDIVEPFLRHNSIFFDEMIVLDHCSTDDTAEIVRKCSKEIGNIHIFSIEEPAYDQSKFTTEALQAAAQKYRPEFVTFLDADEFIGCSGRSAFERELLGIPVGGGGEVKWQTYLPAPMASAPSDPIAQMTFRRREELPQFMKIILRLGEGGAAGITVGQGNHTATIYGKAVETVALGIRYIHMPVRSREQFIAKCVVGWSNNIKRKDRIEGEAFQWERIGRQVLKEGKPLEEVSVDLSQAALEYAQTAPSPKWPDNTIGVLPPISQERKYSDGKFSDPVKLIAKELER